MTIRRFLLTLTLLLTIVSIAKGQNTTLVTSTVKDPNGIAYAFGTYGITFTNPTTQQAFYGGVPLQPSQMLYTGQLDINGNLSISLPSNAVITPAGTQWTFKICANASQIAMVYPPPTLPCFSSAQTISGSSQVITFTAATIPTTGGGITPNSPLPAATSGPGPVFNVKNYGAFGNTVSSDNCTGSGNNLNCTDLHFLTIQGIGLLQNPPQPLVGRRVSCNQASFTNFIPVTTITAVVNDTNVTLAAGANNSGTCIIGTPDDTAVSAALAAALATISSIQTSGNLTVQSAAPTLYFPAGAYNLFNTAIDIVGPVAFNGSGFTLKGDGLDQTKIYWHALSTNAANAGMRCTSLTNFALEGLTFDGAKGTSFGRGTALSCNTYARHVKMQRFNGNGSESPIQLYANDIQSVGNNQIGLLVSGPAEIYESIFSNNFSNNLKIQNVAAMPFGPGVKMYGNLLDEGGVALASVLVQNSTGVWFNGLAGFTGITVDGTSVVHFNGGEQGPFSSDAPITALTILAGGTVLSSDVNYISVGTGKCINNLGLFQDNGNNSCGSGFQIASGTSTGTTAVLTLTPLGANVNTVCSVGDALQVSQANIAGYNGYFAAPSITAVTATTLTYTTVGSNLGAITAGGFAVCRNLQTYAGNFPKAMLNNPIPNTCYVTGTFGATTTAAPMCTFKVQNAANITYIKASSTTVTACTVAPVVTITDGTGTQTLTLTTAKSIWDSSVDTSSGVGTTIFKPNGTITVSNTAGTCTTPPTNFAVSYNISPILSN